MSTTPSGEGGLVPGAPTLPAHAMFTSSVAVEIVDRWYPYIPWVLTFLRGGGKAALSYDYTAEGTWVVHLTIPPDLRQGTPQLWNIEELWLVFQDKEIE